MQLANEISSFLAKTGMSQNKFANILGVNGAYVSGYLKEGSNYKYADKVENPAKNYIDNYIVKNEISDDELPFLVTKDVKSINAVINWAVKDRDMAVISGVAGSGKSRAIAEFCKKHPEAILIEATINTSAKTLLKMLANRLNVDSKGSIDELIRVCADTLSKFNKIIIIDEAEHLPYRALESIRRLYDFSKSTLVLVGTNKLLLNLTSSKNGNELEQLSSRVGSKWVLRGLSYYEQNNKNNDDLKELCLKFGINDDKCISLVESLSRGNFRKSVKLLNRAKLLSENANIELNEQAISEATKMLLLN
ncbi:bacteriophage DNA transposition protein B [Campylobacter pinnipediorum subsp. caledonicus]|uniref:Bacteriophage DNA transposition protein B n=1 Tax=Campylobacter pinnipediorum subsp. caledonicus TaxID=1874362 RepID=A0A1S6U881_9BACT|nr:AAA family ATPase [Campylobacter pinnipediorum]AQW85457.1 bacteriophage DNA transposition protein B [Campylobacter pinnipediorum subsp. caledonicus]AQW87872.1 bacteriophage DNA transposition protein B [Campylobacter pinnipediorum subsp. caledonicus]